MISYSTTNDQFNTNTINKSNISNINNSSCTNIENNGDSKNGNDISEEKNLNEFWNKNSLSSIYGESNLQLINLDDLINKGQEKKEIINPKNKKLVDALVENFKNGSVNINKLLKTQKIINDSIENDDLNLNKKYELPKKKDKKCLENEMEKSYYNNESVIFRNNYTIIPVNTDDATFDERKKKIDNLSLNFDKDLEINGRRREQLLNVRDLDTSKDFYNIFNEREINERVQSIVNKIIPEESKYFKTSLPLFDALSAVEKSRAKYVEVVEQINNIGDVYEDWIREREKAIILNYQATVAKYEKSKSDDAENALEKMLKKEMMQNSVKNEIENLILTNSSLNNKINELTQEIQSTRKENKIIYNILGKLRIKNKKLCEQIKDIIKKDDTSEELMNKKSNDNFEENDIFKNYDGKNIEKSVLMKEIENINNEIENTNSEILC
eukprot:jgi/Orpsp1_1/1184237/evm.model.c7180000088653.1